MLKVLIVENEALERVHLKTLIDWEAYDFQMVGEAENGNEALSMILDLDPDIVITDIRMPVLNGLELMTAVNAGEKHPEFLIMSGYDDYDLVRRGLTLGAYDYLRKLDVNPRSLLEALAGMRGRVGTRTVKDRRDSDMDLRKALRSVILKENHEGFEYEAILAQLGIILSPEAVHCALIKVETETDQAFLSDGPPLSHRIVTISEEILKEAYFAVAIEGRTGEFYLLASPRKASEESSFPKTVERVLEMLSIYLNLEAKAGIGEAHQESPGLFVATQRAQVALKNRFYFEGQSIILWSQVADSARQSDHHPLFALKDSLRHALATQRKDLLEEFFQAFLEKIGQPDWSVTSIKDGLNELRYLVREYFESNQLDPSLYLQRSQMTFEDIHALDNIGEARRWVRSLSDDLLDFLTAEAKVEYSTVILNTQKYVADHFGEDMTLAGVAARASLSPNYFSSIFKRHAGVSFSEYLNNTRVAAAQRLLVASDLLIYEVAERCGFHESYYFCRVFKRVTGCPPGLYKKKYGPQTAP